MLTEMNSTTSKETIHHEFDPSEGMFLLIGITFMILTCIILIKTMCPCRRIVPQVAILIEIPIAVSISTQTVDNEHVGYVL
jgi:hypothetical protein